MTPDGDKLPPQAYLHGAASMLRCMAGDAGWVGTMDPELGGMLADWLDATAKEYCPGGNSAAQAWALVVALRILKDPEGQTP